jgi:CRISPR-associated protein Csx10
MKQIAYQITLKQPVYARALGGDPNSGVSLDYIPGSLVRGVLLFKYAEKKGLALNELDAGKDELRNLFFNGATRFLNAYPVYENQRALPVPQSWQQKKDDKVNVYDFAVAEPTDKEIASNCHSVRTASFWCEQEQQKFFIKLERVLAVHNRRNRKYGRAMDRINMDNEEDKKDDEGMVFRYEALAAGQVFRGLILCDESDAGKLQSLLKDEIYLGGSRAAGYGLAQFEYQSTLDFEREVEGGRPNPLPEVLTFTLLSDALLRDEKSGQFSANAKTLELAIRLRLGMTEKAEIIVDKTFLRSNIVGGFNRKWGLPLPQNVAVSMGSVITLKGGSWSLPAVHKLEELGIGERRTEGFGRITVNWPSMNADFKVIKRDAAPRASSSLTEKPTVNGEGAQEIAKTMLRRILRQKLDEKLVELTQSLEFSTGSIRKSQIFRLRNVIQNLSFGDSDPEQRLRNYFERLEKREGVRKQFEATRSEKENLLQWLKKTAGSTANEKWLALFQIDQETLPALSNVCIDLSAAEEKPFRIEYLLRYIDLALAKLAKEVES